MQSIWRSVFTGLLVLAMPVQGMAALGMQPCAPQLERIAPDATAVQPCHPREPGEASAQVRLAAGNEMLATATAHAVIAGHADSAADLKCSACAACCPALGLPARAPDLPAWPDGSSPAPLTMAAVPVVVPGGPDRPPRSVLA
jgi:hypothetical protein